MSDETMKIAIFQKKEIRKQLHGGEWWFVITDVVAALTDTSDPARYVRDLRYRDEGIKELFEKGDGRVVRVGPCTDRVVDYALLRIQLRDFGLRVVIVGE